MAATYLIPFDLHLAAVTKTMPPTQRSVLATYKF